MTSGTNPRMPSLTGGPVVILDRPQMGENIGSVARAMLNCGLTRLRLVSPRDGWPNERAIPNASGATCVLDGAEVFGTLAEAVADLNYVVATTARPRDMVKEILTPKGAAMSLREKTASGAACGIIFGCERTGIESDDLPLADDIVTVPLNPAFSSLNLAQGVLIMAYEWFQSGLDIQSAELHTGKSEVADKKQLMGLFGRLEDALEDAGFFTSVEQKPSMQCNLRNMLQRARLTTQEINTFHGVISALIGKRKPAAQKQGHEK
ncbi:MAG TPA: rRNA methyltransferase [Rhodospirillaceae bacterium]|nr:MAG: rRNA methyltransferase [Alphaproteobacteria bacterium GWF2_58_20]HAU29323.1 rRNA methyltransferase [Rhodospirillaceae bacterium]